MSDHRFLKQLVGTSLFIAALVALGLAGVGGCGHSNMLSALSVSPASQPLAKGHTLQLTVTAVFGDGPTVPSWTLVNWSTSDPAIATVTKGLVTAVTEGTAIITASDQGHPDISVSATIYVTDLLTITVAPANAVVTAGTGTQFTATGEYSGATPSAWSTSSTWPLVDLTTLVSWVSSSTDIAVVSMETGSQGFATAVSAGTATITATDLSTGITGTATLTVP